MQRLRISRSAVVTAAAVAGIVVCIGHITGVAQDKSRSPLIGVWKVVEVTRTGPNAGTQTDPQPGLCIFTAGYYSVVTVNSDGPRPELPPRREDQTDKQIADAFGPFTANAGSYEVKGNEVIFKLIVAKNPSTMRAGNFGVSTFRLEGKDTLWLTQKAQTSGPVKNPTTMKLSRVE